MSKPQYPPPAASYTKDEIRKSRKTLILLGLGFIVTGLWSIWTDLPLERTSRFVVSALISAFGEENAANALYGLIIFIGVFLFLLVN